MWYGSLRTVRVCDCVWLMWYGSLRTQHVEFFFHQPFEYVSVCLMWYGSLRTLRVCNCVCLMWYGSLRTQHVEVYFHEPFENVSVCLMRYGSLRTLRECDCVCLSLVELFTCYSFNIMLSRTLGYILCTAVYWYTSPAQLSIFCALMLAKCDPQHVTLQRQLRHIHGPAVLSR